VHNRSKKPSATKSVEVNIPISKVSIASVILIGLMTVVGYSGYLGIESVWKFTHPQIKLSLDAFKSLPNLAKRIPLPANPLLTFSGINPPNEAAKTAYLQSITSFNHEFHAKFAKSSLTDLSDNDLLNIGMTLCQAKSEMLAAKGAFSADEIINAYQARLVLRYPSLLGLESYIAGIGHNALNYLCGGI